MSTPRTILVVSNHGEIVGGGEVSLLALLGGLNQAQWVPVVVVPNEGDVAAHCQSLGIRAQVIPLPTLRRPGFAQVRSAISLWRLSRETNACLFHANGSRAMFYSGVAGWLGGKPVIWHVRIMDRDGVFDRFLAWLAALVIVNSQAVARRFDRVAAGKVRCIHNGVDLKRFAPKAARPEVRLALGIPESVPVVVSVGRFVPFKGYAQLLDAARLVCDAKPAVHWVMVGEGELKDTLIARAQTLGIEKQVHFTGWREDTPDLLALGDVFVLPSLGEHFGRVLVEAMGMAKAIVATDAGGVPEIVVHGETGLLVPPGQPGQLADALLELLTDPAKAVQLGLAGRRRAEAHFSLQRHVQAVEDVYGVLSRSGGSK